MNEEEPVLKVYRLAKQINAHTIHEYPHQLQVLSDAVDQLTPASLGLKIPPTPVGRDGNSTPPVFYQPIYSGDDFHMGIFLLPKHAILPLHDHPHMTVITKLLYGNLHVRSFDLNSSSPTHHHHDHHHSHHHDHHHGHHHSHSQTDSSPALSTRSCTCSTSCTCDSSRSSSPASPSSSPHPSTSASASSSQTSSPPASPRPAPECAPLDSVFTFLPPSSNSSSFNSSASSNSASSNSASASLNSAQPSLLPPSSSTSSAWPSPSSPPQPSTSTSISASTSTAASPLPSLLPLSPAASEPSLEISDEMCESVTQIEELLNASILQDRIVSARLTANEIFQAPCEVMKLLPHHRNLHAFTALSDCAMFDLILPPYDVDNDRPCRYYVELQVGHQIGENVKLLEIDEPDDMCVTHDPYCGPSVEDA
eukprot:TRINITY_DN1698_c0_g3_i2.p1 TRINITY_DN1698_c0_g3~~TRINITY_DN1698_c0_g3_i2.p1  ORF type:complete len:423 (+),score=97.48 TRINITY_DN1698_c0_g3_i2:83-1351(+)